MDPRNAWFRQAAMSNSPTSSDHHHLCTCGHLRHPKPASALPRVRIPRFNVAIFAMLDQAQRARMAQNRQQALLRLYKKQNLMITAKDTCRMAVPHGESQLSSSSAVIDLTFCVPTAKSSQQNISLTGTFDLGHCGSALVTNQQDSRLTQNQCDSNAPFNGILKDSSDLQGLKVVANESNATAEDSEVLGSAPSVRSQELDYVVVIDFEATCDKNMEKLKPQEIIEFPAVLVDCQRLALGDFFQTYVKPEHHPILTEFCTRLTGIGQEQVDKGMSLSEAIYWHDKWLEKNGIKDKNFAILIWSDWDCQVMLDSECKLKGLEKPHYFNRWINLKALFQGAFNGRKCNLRKAVEASGLQWAGRAHCGLHDAINTARLAIELMRRGTILTVTSSLKVEAAATKVNDSLGSTLVSTSEKFSSSTLGSYDGSDNCVESSLGSVDGSEVSKQISSPDASRSFGSINTATNPVFCYCGVICNRHAVKKLGPNHGKHFLACGKWTPSEGSKCGFFEWAGN